MVHAGMARARLGLLPVPRVRTPGPAKAKHFRPAVVSLARDGGLDLASVMKATLHREQLPRHPTRRNTRAPPPKRLASNSEKLLRTPHSFRGSTTETWYNTAGDVTGRDVCAPYGPPGRER